MHALPHDNYPEEKVEEILSVNIKSPVALIREFSRGMARKGKGRIVNVASIAGEIGHPDVWYGITKAGMINVTKSFAKTLGPKGIVVNDTGFIYVVDNANHRIQVFDSSGNFITKWGTSGTGDGQFDYPIGITINSTGYIYITDSENHRIQVFDDKGTFIRKWGSYGTADGQFNGSFRIAVNEL